MRTVRHGTQHGDALRRHLDATRSKKRLVS
jgi:hypothetical protein